MITSKVYQLRQEQVFYNSREELWNFISRPENLNEITPDILNFEILDDLPEVMFNGLLINYRIKLPILGKTPWTTEIKHIREGVSFVDEQREGPYKLWYHFHMLEDVPEGVKMTDVVTYQLPFGFLGRIGHELQVKSMLRDIFDYRSEKMAELFKAHPEYAE